MKISSTCSPERYFPVNDSLSGLCIPGNAERCDTSHLLSLFLGHTLCTACNAQQVPFRGRAYCWALMKNLEKGRGRCEAGGSGAAKVLSRDPRGCQTETQSDASSNSRAHVSQSPGLFMSSFLIPLLDSRAPWRDGCSAILLRADHVQCSSQVLGKRGDSPRAGLCLRGDGLSFLRGALRDPTN